MPLPAFLPPLLAGLGMGAVEAGVSIWQQKKTWEREDEAYSRAIGDMRRAGVNPQLYQGAAAPTSQPFRVTSPMQKSLEFAQLGQALAGGAKMKAEAKLMKEKARTEAVLRGHYERMKPLEEISQAYDNLIKSLTWEQEVSMRKSAASIAASGVDIEAVKAEVAKTYGVKMAELEHAINALSLQIQQETGMRKAEADIEAVIVHTAIEAETATYYGRVGMPPAGPKGKIANIVAHLMNVFKFGKPSERSNPRGRGNTR